MSWSQLGLFAGQYISGGDVTPENFPPESPGDVRPVREYRFDRNIQGLEALERLRKEGLEIARPRATSEYLEDNPDLQKQFSVIGAGVWQPRPGKILMVQ
ncbi:MAG TPA: hypothetical protein VJH75_02940, partial [Patescibacteria group bacterium]|nr:hypothetical protein [Patescibacteria group bacterium]